MSFGATRPAYQLCPPLPSLATDRADTLLDPPTNDQYFEFSAQTSPLIECFLLPDPENLQAAFV